MLSVGCSVARYQSQASNCRRQVTKAGGPLERHRVPSRINERIIINVGGSRFETYTDTLNYDPDTLLGDATRRAAYCNAANGEIFLQRSADIFHNILFYYQSKGILAKPCDVTEEQFKQELQFYAITHSMGQPEDEEWMADDLPPPRDPEQQSGSPQPWRERIWCAVEYPHSSAVARYFAKISFCFIIVSIVTYCLETLPSIKDHPDEKTRRQLRLTFQVIEGACIAWFLVEYALRVYATPFRWKFLRSPMGVIDLSVIVPYLITLLLYSPRSSDVISFAFLRIIRLVRVLRIFKLSRYSRGMKVLGMTVKQSLDQLKALSLCLAMAILLSSSAFYYFEGYGNEHSTFTSIPASFWFVIITMTTVGYGDMIPQTISGRILSSLCVSSGVIILLCLPTPVFIAHFSKFYRIMSKKAQRTHVTEAGLDDSGSLAQVESGDLRSTSLLLRSRQTVEMTEQEAKFKQQEVNKGFLTPIWVRDAHQT